jgi:hypothetical protein
MVVAHFLAASIVAFSHHVAETLLPFQPLPLQPQHV